MAACLAWPPYLQSYSLPPDFHDLLVKVDADGVHVRRRERLGREPLRYGGLSDASLTCIRVQHYAGFD